MTTPHTNAFTTNSLAGSFFPFSIKVSQKGIVSNIFVCAQTVIDLCDLIQIHTLDYLVIFNVEQASQFDKFTKAEIPIEGLAINAKISFSAIDSKTIVLPKENLLPLLSTFGHYNLCLFDMGHDWNESQVISQVLAYREHDWRSQEAVLPKLPASRFFLDSHDDCYLEIETYNQNISKNVFIRTLQIYAATILTENDISISEFPDFHQDLLDQFWKDDFGLTILKKATGIKNNCLKIGVSKKSYDFREKAKYSPEFWLIYEIESQKWLVQI